MPLYDEEDLFPRPVMSEARIAELAGLVEPDPSEFVLPQQNFETSGFERFLENFAGSMSGGVSAPRGFAESLLTGIAGGLANRGSQVAKRRQQFEAKQAQRQRDLDAERRQASKDYRAQRGQFLRDSSLEQRRERQAQRDFERDNPAVTEAHLRDMPWLKRTYKVGDRAPVSVLTRPPDRPSAGEKERTIAVETPEGIDYMSESEARALAPFKKPPKLARPNASQQEALADDIVMLNQINDMRGAFKKEFTGPAAGPIGALTTKTGFFAKEGEGSFRAIVQSIRNQIGKMRSGQSLTEQETENLLRELPTANDPSQEFINKLDRFERLFRMIAQTRRDVMGGSDIDLERQPGLPSPVQTGSAAAGRKKPAEQPAPNGEFVRGPDGKLTWMGGR